MIESATISETQQLHEQLSDAARVAASWDVVHRPTTNGTFAARVQAARLALRQLEKDLASLSTADAACGDIRSPSQRSALLDLRENFRLLRSAISGLSDNPRVASQLPRVILNGQRDEPRAAACAEIYLNAVDGEFSASTFRMFVGELQTPEPLAVGELWSLTNFLEFALLESLLVEARTLLSPSGGLQKSLVSVRLASLRVIGHADWVTIIEPLIAFDATLRQDPAKAYASMDFESRECYRHRVAFISRHSDCTESAIAEAVLELAQEAVHLPSDDPRIYLRRIHVGYYLIDKGLPQLAARVGFHPPLADRVRAFIRAIGDDFYIVGIALITIFFVAAALFPLLSRYSVSALAIAVALILLPFMRDAFAEVELG